jgi:hypothetical protein
MTIVQVDSEEKLMIEILKELFFLFHCYEKKFYVFCFNPEISEIADAVIKYRSLGNGEYNVDIKQFCYEQVLPTASTHIKTEREFLPIRIDWNAPPEIKWNEVIQNIEDSSIEKTPIIDFGILVYMAVVSYLTASQSRIDKWVEKEATSFWSHYSNDDFKRFLPDDVLRLFQFPLTVVMSVRMLRLRLGTNQFEVPLPLIEMCHQQATIILNERMERQQMIQGSYSGPINQKPKEYTSEITSIIKYVKCIPDCQRNLILRWETEHLHRDERFVLFSFLAQSVKDKDLQNQIGYELMKRDETISTGPSLVPGTKNRKYLLQFHESMKAPKDPKIKSHGCRKLCKNGLCPHRYDPENKQIRSGVIENIELNITQKRCAASGFKNVDRIEHPLHFLSLKSLVT